MNTGVQPVIHLAAWSLSPYQGETVSFITNQFTGHLSLSANSVQSCAKNTTDHCLALHRTNSRGLVK